MRKNTSKKFRVFRNFAPSALKNKNFGGFGETALPFQIPIVLEIKNKRVR